MADQLFGQFLIFFGRPKENCPVSEAASMYFWSVCWSTKQSFFWSTKKSCPVSLVDQSSGLFLIYFGRPKKNCPVSETRQKNFGQSLNLFWSVSDFFRVHPLQERLTKENSETDQHFVVQSLMGRPCGFGQSVWPTNCPVNFYFFWLAKRKLSCLRDQTSFLTTLLNFLSSLF